MTTAINLLLLFDTAANVAPPPPADNLWVEDSTGNQMVTSDGKSYVFVTE